jgi:uncharacterized membrane protein
MNKLTLSLRITQLALLLQIVLLTFATLDRPDMDLSNLGTLGAGLILSLFKALPFLILLPGVLRGSGKAVSWLAYVLMLYFIVWILAAFGTQGSTLGKAGTFVTLIQFVAASMYIRWEKRQPAA